MSFAFRVAEKVVKIHLRAWEDQIVHHSMAVRLEHLYQMIWLAPNDGVDVREILCLLPKFFLADIAKLFSCKLQRLVALPLWSV